MSDARLAFVLLAGLIVPGCATAGNIDKLYRSGLIAQRQHRIQDALRQLEAARALSPGNENILLSLAYARREAGDLAGAAELFAKVEARAAPAAKIPLELAYLHKRMGHDREAAAWFRRGLPLETGPGARFRLRREIQQLESRWDIGIYSIFRANETIRPRGRLTGIDQTQSQGGLEGGRRFSAFGGNGRYVMPYARLLWSYDGNSLNPRGKSAQGGIGVHVKPLSQFNLVLGAERLAQLGRESRGDWMLRASFGWDTGSDYRDGVNVWPVAQLYLDAAAINPAHADLYLTAETRIGASIPLARGLVITPHLLAAANWQDEASAQNENRDKSRIEAGPGLSARFWFSETAATAWAASLELTLQYRIGLGGTRHLPDGLALTLAARF